MTSRGHALAKPWWVGVGELSDGATSARVNIRVYVGMCERVAYESVAVCTRACKHPL